MHHSPFRIAQRGFTITEILLVVALIAILATVILGRMTSVRELAFESRAALEMRSFGTALEIYRQDNFGQYPPDEDRTIPAAMLTAVSDGDWPIGAWPGSIYDWDAWQSGGEQVYQLSVRFCPESGPIEDCRFPDLPWAEDFGVNSAYFYCFAGPCQSHRSESASYPGYCVNCDCKGMSSC